MVQYKKYWWSVPT